MEYSLFFHIWPWIGCGAALVLLIICLFTDIFRKNKTLPRWSDPSWLAWILAVIYLLHNVEEYGIDINGVTISFAKMMAQLMPPGLTEWTYTSINISMFWIVAPLIALAARKFPSLAGFMATIVIVNGLSHCASFAMGGYNPGLATGILLFLPIGFWTLYVLKKKTGVGKKLFWGIFAWGFVCHMSLYISIILNRTGIINDTAQGWFMWISDFACGLFVYRFAKKQEEKQLQM